MSCQMIISPSVHIAAQRAYPDLLIRWRWSSDAVGGHTSIVLVTGSDADAQNF